VIERESGRGYLREPKLCRGGDLKHLYLTLISYIEKERSLLERECGMRERGTSQEGAGGQEQPQEYMQTQKLNNAQAQTGVKGKTQDRKDNKASPRYNTTLL